MKILLKYIFFLALFDSISYGVGVPAGTIMKNIAILSYTSEDINYTKQSNEVVDTVLQLIDLKLEWMDSVAPVVESGDKSQVLTFRLTNLGNARDTFALSMIHRDDSAFSVENTQLIRDINGNGIYEAKIDTPISNITLDADATVLLFIVADIPELDLIQSGYDNELISVVSVTPATTGSEGQDLFPIILGSLGGKSSVLGRYHSLAYRLNVDKRAIVKNQIGTSIASRGSIITYQIFLSMEGFGEIKNIVVKDTIPEGTIYKIGTLMLDGKALSDGIDGDAGAFDADAISVEIASMKQTSSQTPQHTVSFKVQIQ